MRIVLKINDDSPLGLFLKQRMAETGLEVSTIARSILFQAMREAQAGGDDSSTVHPRTFDPPRPVEEIAPDDDDDDNAILMGLLGDM